ncbi:hypothetical protein M1B72_14075 [Geomonas paludis]|uniref:Uncharacterized protein n=1 Tax=Geomonas paludis TaxID=2740185 RepID=A0A6V8N0Z5_9BACT|nr:hypothetical protein [Geomonas paludis]UPU34572.1 hypothetical protein M1B72_14075 [Geomonas paludis]GFO66030.1 hypothetical protein GMPD_39490 [Geomonas paludis]
MVRSILEIGNAKYKIDRIALGRFRDEVRQNWSRESAEAAPEAGGDVTLDESLDAVFLEVMQLYNEYAKSESIDVLLRLKDKLEQVSLRYKSLALAEEVLNINSCLPYERRIPKDCEISPTKH